METKHSEKQLTNRGRHLAFLLRHDKEAFDNGIIDANGWRQVSELIKEQGYTRELLEEIVETNNKKRYEFSPDGRKIRARQGHSIPVDVGLTEAIPPKVLYHGTSAKTFYQYIQLEGLKPMSRQHVHLSADEETARKVGQRHSSDVYIIKIDTERMHSDGHVFWQSANGVWLTGEVPPEYFIY